MIPGVETVHPRSAWVDPNYPIDGPFDLQSDNDTCVIHYTAADDLIDGDPGEHAEDLPQFFRNMQKSYEDRRGYSVGYSWAVDWLGGVWQLRGWEFQSAANLGHNSHTVPILVLVDGQDGTTPEAAKSVRNIVREAARRAGRKTMIVTGHGRLSGAATQCPGLGLLSQLDRGWFNPANYPFDNVEIPKEDEVVTADLIVPPEERAGSPWLVVVDADVRPATSFDVTNPKLTQRVLVDGYRVQQYDDLYKAAFHGA